MKQVVYLMVSVFIGVLIVISLFFLWCRQSRKNELDNSVTYAMEQTIEGTLKGKGRIRTEEDMRNTFEKILLKQIKSGDSKERNKDLKLGIEYYEIDPKKGIISCKVWEDFSYPNGRTGKLSIERTAIRERMRTKEFVEVSIKGYKTYTIEAGSNFDIPKGLTIDGKEVKGWRDSSGRIYKFPMKVSENIVIEPVL